MTTRLNYAYRYYARMGIVCESEEVVHSFEMKEN
jgi:hypothetical protein